MKTVRVELGAHSYDVRIGAGLVDGIGAQSGDLLRTETVPVVTDANVAALYRGRVDAALARSGKSASWLVLPAGEATKSWEQLARVCAFLLDHGVERRDHVVALGGGVIGDLVGFAASVTKRGCGFIQVPTTLLAQVDSSVGGKTAINVPAGKNLVGAFHQPSLVLADTAALDTLPARDLRAGYAEVVKYGLIDDAGFFDWCEANGGALLSGDADARAYAIERSVAAKARIVAEDERETTGRRALLNLGHTFGHALEAETGYGDALLHGEAVSLGMVLAARYSARRELMPSREAERVTDHLSLAGLPTEIAALSLDANGAKLAEHMRHDKKMEGGTLPFLLMRGIGGTFVARDVDVADVAAFLDTQLPAH